MQSPFPGNTSAEKGYEDPAYVDQAADLLGLSIPAELRPSVMENFKHVQAIAQPVLAFSLPNQLEPGFRFAP